MSSYEKEPIKAVASAYDKELIEAVTLDGEYTEDDIVFFQNMIATCSAGNDPTKMMVQMMKDEDEEIEPPAGTKNTQPHQAAPDCWSWKYIEDVKDDPNRGVEGTYLCWFGCEVYVMQHL